MFISVCKYYLSLSLCAITSLESKITKHQTVQEKKKDSLSKDKAVIESYAKMAWMIELSADRNFKIALIIMLKDISGKCESYA